MTHEMKPRTVPWIERIAHWVPGYGGYLERGNRRAADQALREVISKKLDSIQPTLEEAVRKLVSDGFLTQIGAIERVTRHVEKTSARIKAAGSGTSDFQGSSNLDPQKADALHAFDFDLLQRTENICRHVEVPDHDGDWLAHLETMLRELDTRLDERLNLLQGIR